MFRRIATIALGLLAVGSAAAFAQEAKQLEIGAKAPGFVELAGIDGKNHSLDDYKKAKAVVVCFTCNTCPIAGAYESRFIEFVKTYKDKGVEFVAVNVNNSAEDKLEQMQERAAKKGFNFDYLKDPSQESARGFHAKVTPHLFVLDGERKLAYVGKFDDSFNPNKVTAHYVNNAVDALLAGKEVETPRTKAEGCGIPYENE